MINALPYDLKPRTIGFALKDDDLGQKVYAVSKRYGEKLAECHSAEFVNLTKRGKNEARQLKFDFR